MQDFAISLVIGRTAAQVDKALGKPLSVGQGGTFREYGTRRSSWYVTFKGGIATSATVTFRSAFAKPEQALEAIGIRIGKAKPVKQNLLLRRWERAERFTSLEVRSLDGKRWETVEVIR